jgi:hypothetical protein
VADLARLYNFLSGDVIRSSEVDAEFDQLIARINDLPDEAFSSSAGMYATYRTLLAGTGAAESAAVAGTYAFSQGADEILASGTANNEFLPVALYLDDADYTISGRTTKLRLRAQAYTNGAGPGITLTVGLHNITGSTGSAGQNSVTLAAAVAGSTVAFASPAQNTLTQGNSGDFNVPADGYYALGVVLSGTLAADARVMLAAQLQQRWV